MTSNTMPLSTLRNHKLFKELACQLRMHSLTFSPTSNLGFGGTGTLSKYKNLSGLLTATHVMADHLDSKEIFAPVAANTNPTFFLCDKIPIKRIIYLETTQGIQLLKGPYPYWPTDTLDICFIDIEEEIFQNILQRSGKNSIQLSCHQNKYLKDYKTYCENPNDWVWAFERSPRIGSKQNDDNILISKFDGCYASGGGYVTTPLINVIPPFDGNVDLCIHPLKPTIDPLPQIFEGASGAGMYQVSLEGNNGIPEHIHEIFFSGVLVGASSAALMSRGPDSLYNTFLPYLNTFCS